MTINKNVYENNAYFNFISNKPKSKARAISVDTIIIQPSNENKVSSIKLLDPKALLETPTSQLTN